MSDTTDGQGDDPIDRTGPDRGSDAFDDGALDDERTLLASAYLDGEATDAERRQVEADPELLDEVEALRQVRAVLGATTPPPPISVRESHLAAALGVWDRMSDLERSGDATPDRGMDAAAVAAISTPRSPSSPARRRRESSATSSKWFLGAAAGFIAIAGTGLVIRGLTSSDDDSVDLADAPIARESDDDASSEPEILAAEASDAFEGVEGDPELPPVDDDAAFEEDNRPDDGGGAADEAETAPAAEAPMEEPAEEPAEEATEEAADDAMSDSESMDADEAMEEVASEPADGGEADPFPPDDELARLASLEDLEDFAAEAYYAPVDADAPSIDLEQPYPTCDDEFEPFFTLEVFAGPALYVTGAPPTEVEEQVIVAVDDDDPATVVAYRPDDCVVVEQTPLPSLEEFETRRSQP